MPHLFEPLPIRGVTFSNRVFVSPMCEYSSTDGFANDWHFVHLGSRAVGGAGLVFTEATAVTPEGRISPDDLGIWKDDHVDMLARIVRFVHAQGSVAGMQLAHAGRKASTYRPWSGNGAVGNAEGGWANVLAPTAIAFADNYPQPREMSKQDILDTTAAFAAAATRAHAAGFRVLELHAAHGYLLHEFLSPLSNQRTDEYGGSFENRTRIVREVAAAIRKVWPDASPLFTRISSTDWVSGGWDIEQSVALCQALRERGVDLIDVSSGGTVPDAKIPVARGYQVPFSQRIREEAGIRTGAVGMISDAQFADGIITSGQANMIFLARELLREPYWAIKAQHALEEEPVWPIQYGYAVKRRTR